MLVFAPAAPLLYFIGGGALLVWAAMQKLALCKIYRKPRSLDETAAMRSRHFLHFLLAVHALLRARARARARARVRVLVRVRVRARVRVTHT